MKKLLFLVIIFSSAASAQKVDSIFFNLYTDSLKIGVHNYINVDGKMKDGSFYPLMSDEVVFISSTGTWEGNSIILDSACISEKVIITAKLKSNPSVKKSVTIYVKRLLIDPPLKTEAELLDEWKRKDKRRKS